MKGVLFTFLEFTEAEVVIDGLTSIVITGRLQQICLLKDLAACALRTSQNIRILFERVTNGCTGDVVWNTLNTWVFFCANLRGNT